MKRHLFIPVIAAVILSGCVFDSNTTTKKTPSGFEITGNESYVSPNNASPENAINQSTGLEAQWWRKSSFYHIWVKAFNNSDSTYCGDLKGITAKLDYIQNTVGCDAIWLSPIFKCKYVDYNESGNMHGYDTTDYYSVNPYFGTEDDLVELINACHARGMKIIFDFVPNHTATNNTWFTNSAAGKTVNGVDYSDWYVWSDTVVNINNTMKSAADSWHTWSGSKKKYYYGCFDSSMPDLNYGRFEVREEMKNVARYWLNKGFDGLRLDGARYLCEQNGIGYDTLASHEFYQELRTELNRYSSPKFMVCEAWVTDNRSTLNSYLGDSDEFNIAFDFDAGIPCITSVYSGKDKTGSTIRSNYSSTQSYGTFLGNHDEYTATCGSTGYIRFGSALSQDALKIREAIGLSLMRPTVPFIYYGNEFGMKEYGSSGDMRARGPMSWSLTTAQTTTVQMNKALLDLRRAYPEAFQSGTVSKATSSSTSVMGYTITGSDGTLLCVYNLSDGSIASADLTCGASYTSADLLIGGGSNNTALSYSGKKITVSELGPNAVRVYLMNADDGKDAYYSLEQTYGTTSVPETAWSNVYLLGSMNSWTADSSSKMVESINSSNQIIWTFTTTIEASTQAFKVKADSTWFGINDLSHDSTITESSGTDGNMSYTFPSTGSYTFTYNETTKSITVTAN